jgi:cell division protein FtsZ
MDELFANSPVVKIKVVGCGGAGNNSIDRMLEDNLDLDGVEFVAINTDGQVLNKCRAENKLCIGEKLCKRQGCGGDPAVGQAAAEESRTDIRQVLEGTDLVFITAGMGGGTGTGASPVVASIAKELGILTVAVVSKPFDFEGSHRILNAEIGISNLEKFVDAIVVVPNQKIVENYKKLNIREAFKKADEVLQEGVMGLAELIVTPMLIKLDFADIKTVLRGAGKAHMGIGKAKGENRVLDAIRRAVSSPLLETNITGATRIIMCVKGGDDLDFSEVSNCGMLVRDAVDPGCNIIHGVNLVPEITDEVQVLIVAAGFPEYSSGSEQDAEIGIGGNPITAESAEEIAEPIEDDEPVTQKIQELARPKFFGFFKNFKK